MSGKAIKISIGDPPDFEPHEDFVRLFAPSPAEADRFVAVYSMMRKLARSSAPRPLPYEMLLALVKVRRARRRRRLWATRVQRRQQRFDMIIFDEVGIFVPSSEPSDDVAHALGYAELALAYADAPPVDDRDRGKA